MNDLLKNVVKQILEKVQQGGVWGKYSWDEELLRKSGELVVGNMAEVRMQILSWLHASYQGHNGIHATY